MVNRIDWRIATLVIGMVFVDLLTGFQSAGHSQYRSTEAIFEDFMNGPVRLLFPIVVAVIASTKTSGEMSDHFIASTRARVDIRKRVWVEFLRVSTVIFLAFAVLAAINGVAAFVIAPAIYPDAIDPDSYGSFGSPAAVFAADIADAPLVYFLKYGTVAFVTVAAIWLGLNAVIFGTIGLIAAFWIRLPLVAFLLPLAVYLAESIAFQVMSLPGPSFLISAVFPAGIEHYITTQAILPSLILGVIVVFGVIATILRSPHSPRFS